MTGEPSRLSRLTFCAVSLSVYIRIGNWTDVVFLFTGMLDASEAERRDVAVATFAATEGSKVIAELRHHDRSTLRALLAEAFREADEDGDGTLDPSELQNVLLALVRFFFKSYFRMGNSTDDVVFC